MEEIAIHLFLLVFAFILKLFTNWNDSPGARNGHTEAGTGGGAAKKGRTGEKASGGDKQAAKTHRTRGETARKTEGTGKKSKTLSLSLMNDLYCRFQTLFWHPTRAFSRVSVAVYFSFCMVSIKSVLTALSIALIHHPLFSFRTISCWQQQKES